MAEHPTSGTVIHGMSRTGDIGEPGYSTSGRYLPTQSKYSNKTNGDWRAATQDAIYYAMPTSSYYITESVFNYMTDDEIDDIRNRCVGIVPDKYYHSYYVGLSSFGNSIYQWEFLPGIEARPLPPKPETGITIVGWTLQDNAILGSSVVATLNLTNKSIDNNAFIKAVVGGVGPAGDPISGNVGYILSGGQSISLDCVIDIPSNISTGDYNLYADVYALEGFPNTHLATSSGSKTLTISECPTPVCNLTIK